MIDHFGLDVADIARSKRFYAAALAPLGIVIVKERAEPGDGVQAGVGFGPPGGHPLLWIAPGGPMQPMHFAFAAADRATVEAFHRAALAAGGRDNGAPGIRARYHPDYYGAFVLDPDGHNVEAVCHRPG